MLDRLAALAAGLMLTLAPAAAQEKIKFTLDWKLQGIHAWYYWAAERATSRPKASTSPSTRAKARPRP